LQPRATPASTQEEWYRFQSLNRPTSDSLPDEAVVRVVSRGVGCSGTLITNNLVLTAHHCMVERDANGEILDRDLPASELEVEVGGDFHPLTTVPVAAVLAPPCGQRGGNGDIAVLVLSRRLNGIPVMPVRLSEPPRKGEPVEPLGFGHCPLSSESHSIRHQGGPIDGLDATSLSASTSICPGDSGGPARSSETGEVVGVISAGVMDDNDQTRDATSFTRLDVWRPLFAGAQQIVDGSTPAEVPPISGCERE
jgi:secreted trypsin-like serine protease